MLSVVVACVVVAGVLVAGAVYLQTIVFDCYRESRQMPIHCQRCGSRPDAETEKDGTRGVLGGSDTAGHRADALGMCQQCLTFLCQHCVDTGDSESHQCVVVRPVSAAKSWISSSGGGGVSKCLDHADESPSLYCVDCQTPVCRQCVEHSESTHDSRHFTHRTQPLDVVARTHKVSRTAFVVLKLKFKVKSRFICIAS